MFYLLNAADLVQTHIGERLCDQPGRLGLT